jgi:DNA adenine methylase
MARSSTTYAPKWHSGKTCVLRVPSVLADEVLSYARNLDAKRSKSKVREDGTPYLLEIQNASKPLDTRKPVNVASVPQRSPFRYPGGKTWLVPFLRAWLHDLPEKPDLFIEPFAGGGIASLTVAFEHLSEHVILAETDDGVAAVWKTILNGQGEWLASQILDFKLNVTNAKAALAEENNGSPLSLRRRAFLTILRNRVQRGGIMAPGAGLVKNGENNKGISSRWYPETLARRIREISMNLHRLSFYPDDGFKLIDEYTADDRAAFYVDPPYTKAARRLYRQWQVDHRRLFEKMASVSGTFLMSYDNEKEVRDLAKEFGFDSRPVRMKNTHHAEMTELLIGRDLSWLDRNGTKNLPASSAKTSRKRRGSLVYHR